MRRVSHSIAIVTIEVTGLTSVLGPFNGFPPVFNPLGLVAFDSRTEI